MRHRSLVWTLVGFVMIAVVALGATLVSGNKPLLGLDLRGGVSVVLRPQGTVDNATLAQAVTIIQRRVNGLGVANSTVQRQGHDVVIELPGIKDSQHALKVLGTTAELFFRPVICSVPPYSAAKPTTTKGAVSTTAPVSAADCTASNAAQLKSTAPNQDTIHATVLVPASKNSGYTGRFILGPADLTGSAVKTAYVSLPQGSASYAVQLTFNSAGSKAFNQMAAVRHQFYSASASAPSFKSLEGIELDGLLESAPQIQQANFNGSAQITGSFTSAQASALALDLRYGSLPVRFTPQSVQTVSATIGKDSLRAGLLAGLGGVVVVLLYMILYYRALGFVVVIGLGIGGALLYSILTELSQTSSLALTLAGVTGIIVSVGITVDSYVVYFERLKDEVRAGRTVRQSVERSFARAFRTVLTADFVSFLAALILYVLTVGSVRGFAFTLGLSTLLDVVTAYFFIRPMVILVGRRRSFAEAPILGVARGLGAPAGVGN